MYVSQSPHMDITNDSISGECLATTIFYYIPNSIRELNMFFEGFTILIIIIRQVIDCLFVWSWRERNLWIRFEKLIDKTYKTNKYFIAIANTLGMNCVFVW